MEWWNSKKKFWENFDIYWETIYYGKIYNYRRRQKTYNGFV